MTDLIVFAGPNGSGKSSVRDAAANPAEVVIDPDRIARQLNPADPRSVDAQAGKAAVRLFEESLAQGQSICLETTLTGHSAVLRMQRAKDAGYAVSLVYVALHDPELNVRRVAARVRQGGHRIDPATIRRRVGASLANLSRALAIADQAIVLDNSGPTHRRVLETAAGRVTYLSEPLPQWLDRQMPAILAALAGRPGLQAGAAQPAAQRRVGPLSNILATLRPSEPDAAAPGTPAPAALAERLAAFERAAAERAKKPGAAGPEPELEVPPKPASGPKP